MLRIAPLAACASLAACALLAASPASAEWHRASSPHFIIYADQRPADLKAFAEKLERFDQAVRVARSMKDPPVGDGNRLTVFVVPGALDVQKLMPGTNGNALGFYRPRYWNSIAVVPRLLSRNWSLDAQTVFFHEYAHHLMFSDMRTPVPTWLVEGFAEFMSTAVVGTDGSVGLGAGAVHRASVLRAPTRFKVPLTTILGGDRLLTGFERVSLYARGWLLAHYLTFSPARRGQIEAYLDAIARGQPQLDAARAVFGDLGQLDRELDAYLNANKFPYLTLPASEVRIGAITVEPLGAGAAAIVPLMMKVQIGLERKKRAALATDARRLAAVHPDDPLMAMTLAAAELYNDNFALADAAADRAVALAPNSAEALILKGRAAVGRAKSGDKAVTFATARGWFNRANRLDPENPEPLVAFYRSFIEQRIQPTANAIAALHYASSLAPHDMGLRMTSARRYLDDRKPAEARKTLIAIAYNPHGGSLGEEARRLIGLIDSGQVAAAAAARPAFPDPSAPGN